MFLRTGSKSSRNFSTGIFPARKSCARLSDCSSDSAAAVCSRACVVSGDMPADFVSVEQKNWHLHVISVYLKIKRPARYISRVYKNFNYKTQIHFWGPYKYLYCTGLEPASRSGLAVSRAAANHLTVVPTKWVETVDIWVPWFVCLWRQDDSRDSNGVEICRTMFSDQRKENDSRFSRLSVVSPE